MTVESSKIFRDHYTNLLKHPEQAQQDPATLATIRQTFKALGSLGTDAPEKLQVEGRDIPVNTLKRKDLKVFAQFAKKFLQKAEVPEAAAEEMRASLQAIKEHHGGYGRELSRRWAEAETQIALHTTLEAPTEGDDIAIEAKNRVLTALSTQQSQARDLEKQLKKDQRQAKILQGVGIGLVVASSLAFIGGMVALLAFAAPLAIAVSLIVIGGLGAAGFSSLITSAYLKKSPAKFDASLQQFTKLEAYKKSVSEPEFARFAADPKNNYARLKSNDNTFYKLLDIYALQKGYDQDLQKAHDILKDLAAKPVAAGMVLGQPEFQKLNDERTRINALRVELGLEQLPNPDF